MKTGVPSQRGSCTTALYRGTFALLAALASVPGCQKGAVPSSARTDVVATPPGDADAPAAFELRPPKRHIVHTASFPVASTRLTIEDVELSPRLDVALAKSHGEVAVNAGFFDADGAPLGLAVSESKRLSRFSPRMSGGVLWVRSGLAHLTATEDFHEDAVEFAIQCRPRLVVASKVNIKSDDGRRADRTALCLREAGGRIDFVVARGSPLDELSAPTLLEFATELHQAGCEDALNLDGGPSTGWASRRDGGVTYDPPVGAIRHAIVARARG